MSVYKRSGFYYCFGCWPTCLNLEFCTTPSSCIYSFQGCLVGQFLNQQVGFYVVDFCCQNKHTSDCPQQGKRKPQNHNKATQPGYILKFLQVCIMYRANILTIQSWSELAAR